MRRLQFQCKIVECGLPNKTRTRKMQTEKQIQLNNDKLLEDIYSINQASKHETERISSEIRLRIADTDLAENVADAIIEEVSSQLALLAVAVKLTDKAIHSMRPRQMHKFTLPTTGNEVNGEVTDLQFGVDQLANNNKLLPLETSDSGTSYLWSGSDPDIQFSFSLDRSNPLGMQIRLFALIKPEYIKQLKVLVDGTHIKHWVSVDDGLFVVSCNLSPSTTTDRTDIKILLPATHSPKELGISNDHRKLGIAINEIKFGKTGSRFSHLLTKLKLQS